MATDANATLEALDHLMAIQEQHGEILTHLEQRPVPDIAGLARRFEDIADAVDRLRAPEPVTRPRWYTPAAVLIAVVLGWGLCWFTVRWLPSTLLPPGFSRPVPVPQRGRF